MDARRYLQQARLDRHLTLEQIGVRTALSPRVLQDLDAGRFERLPGGLYARSYVRAFAREVGLDPEAALREVEPLLPGAAFGTAPEPAALTMQAEAEAASSDTAAFRSEAARLAAATIDAVVLVSVTGAILFSTASLVDLPIDTFLREAGLPFAAFCAIPILLYFAIFEGVAGCTPGTAVLNTFLPECHDCASRTVELGATQVEQH